MLLPRALPRERRGSRVGVVGAATVAGVAWEPRVGALHASGIFLPHSLERTKGLIDNSWEKEPLLYFLASGGGSRSWWWVQRWCCTSAGVGYGTKPANIRFGE